MKTRALWSLLAGAAIAFAGCGSPDTTPHPLDTGGAVAGTGGATGTGGNTVGTAGSTVGTGGNGTGGVSAGTGGQLATGGTQATGGNPTTGGTAGTGGGPSTAGTTGTAGKVGTGGTAGTGGKGGTGGTAGTGGKAGTGGAAGTGGGPSTAGTSGTAGRAGTGGTVTGSGGSMTGSCTDADKTVSGNATGTHCGYTYEYWKDSGNASLVLKSDGFSTTWSGINDYVGREGVRPGSGNLVVNYSANFQPNGNSYLCVYGWTTNPLVEYYVVESWGSWRPPGTSAAGTVTSDGGTYDIYKSQRVNQPSIQGTATFNQYWSVRQQKITSGAITLANHFNAWSSKGMSMGTFYEVSMTVEGYQSSGSADVKFSIK